MPGREYRCGGTRRLGFAADKIEIPAPTTSLLLTVPPLPGYPNITGMVNTCLLLSSLACRTQRVLKQLFQDTQRFNLP